nr:MAG: hypothetical protein [Chemarfal virus 250]
MAKSRNFTFTMNNYTDTTLVDTVECKYIIYGKEVGESGTPHLQGFISFESMRHFKPVCKLLPGCHVEIARSALAAVAYCKKGGDYVERGVPPLPPKEAGQKGIAERWELAKQGRFEELPPEQIKTYEYIKRKFTEVHDIGWLDNEWIHGPSGCGKSSSVRERYSKFYWKDCSKWWDGYDHEEVVVIEDWDPKCSEYLSRYLKIWADHYAFKAEVKGGSMMIRPHKIIITSQYSLEECFPDRNDYEAVSRRFNVKRMGEMPSAYARLFNPNV